MSSQQIHDWSCEDMENPQVETKNNLVNVFSGNHGRELGSLPPMEAKKSQQASMERKPSKKKVEEVICQSSPENNKAAS